MLISVHCKWRWFSINGSNNFFFYISYWKGFDYLKHRMTQISIKVTQMCPPKIFNQTQVIKLEGKHPQTGPVSLAQPLLNWLVSFTFPWVNSPRGDPRDENITQSHAPLLGRWEPAGFHRHVPTIQFPLSIPGVTTQWDHLFGDIGSIAQLYFPCEKDNKILQAPCPKSEISGKCGLQDKAVTERGH